MEFKFDDTRLSYWHKNKIGRIEFFLLLPDFANSLPCWLSHQNWASKQGRKSAKSGSNKKKFQFCQSYSFVNRKVWYHQIWIPNNLDFIVSDLIYIASRSMGNGRKCVPFFGFFTTLYFTNSNAFLNYVAYLPLTSWYHKL